MCRTPKESRGVFRCGLSGHMAHSEGIRWGLSVWAFGTRGTLRRNPKGSLGVGFRDTWHTPKESEGVSRCGLSGYVAHSEGIRRVALDLGTRDTWHTQKTSTGDS